MYEVIASDMAVFSSFDKKAAMKVFEWHASRHKHVRLFLHGEYGRTVLLLESMGW